VQFFELVQSLFLQAIDIFLHLDLYLNSWAGALGPWVYVLLFLILFCETGVVVWPFLPGDSLLFAIGALAATEGSVLSLPVILILLPFAAILGDTTNYFIGNRIGPKVFHAENSWLLNKKHLMRAHEFYEKHGRKTIIIARFVPIVRTFAPFVAGVGSMPYRRFIGFSIFGGIVWIYMFSIAGYLFGNQEWVKRQFHIVIVAIIIISVLPMVFEFLKEYRRGRAAPPSR
jgi:membrane-associated protein